MRVDIIVVLCCTIVSQPSIPLYVNIIFTYTWWYSDTRSCVGVFYIGRTVSNLFIDDSKFTNFHVTYMC